MGFFHQIHPISKKFVTVVKLWIRFWSLLIIHVSSLISWQSSPTVMFHWYPLNTFYTCARLPRYSVTKYLQTIWWCQLVSSGRCSWKRLHAFFHLHCVHHMARFSMPYTLRHFLTSVRDLRWPDDVDLSTKWLLVDCNSCESNECGSYSTYTNWFNVQLSGELIIFRENLCGKMVCHPINSIRTLKETM